MRTLVRGNLVLREETEPRGGVLLEERNILGVFPEALAEKVSAERTLDFGEKVIAPGFVDIHCHGSPEILGADDPVAAAREHYSHGTTSLLLSLYRNLNFEETMTALGRIRDAMRGEAGNLLGAHMEGPYLNPDFGSKRSDTVRIQPNEYRRILGTGIVRQWTFSPEFEGGCEFCAEIAAAGVVPAIGHSRASADEVRRAVKNGARIVTHITDATGASVYPSRYPGTKEVDFDAACLLSDGLFYEIINDREGIHVRKDMIRLLIKIAGIGRIVGITDCFPGGEAGRDVNFTNGELSGSRLTMDEVARNFLALGLTLPEVFRVTSYNPARALRLENRIGQLCAGCRADLLVTDENLTEIEVLRL